MLPRNVTGNLDDLTLHSQGVLEVCHGLCNHIVVFHKRKQSFKWAAYMISNRLLLLWRIFLQLRALESAALSSTIGSTAGIQDSGIQDRTNGECPVARAS